VWNLFDEFLYEDHHTICCDDLGNGCCYFSLWSVIVSDITSMYNKYKSYSTSKLAQRLISLNRQLEDAFSRNEPWAEIEIELSIVEQLLDEEKTTRKRKKTVDNLEWC